MLALLALFLWFAFFSFLLFRIVRNRKVSMSLREVIAAYAGKVLFGCLYGYVFLHYFNGDDTWLLHSNSLRETKMLLDQPYQFFWEFTPITALRNGNHGIASIGFYLRDLEYCLQAKTLGIINLVSQGNYYINTVFWNFILFWGHYWLFCLLTESFPEKRKIFFFLIFLFPPALFWLSGIRADGPLFFFFSLFALSFYRLLRSSSVSYMLLCCVGYLGILIFRAPVAMLIIPAFTAWWMATVSTRKAWIHFVWVYASAINVFFLSLLTPYSLPSVVAERQAEFSKLRGTRFQLDELTPSVSSFGKVLPQAVVNTFFRPVPWEAKGILQFVASLEAMLVWACVLFILWHLRRNLVDLFTNATILFLIFFGVSLYVLIGYVVPFPGAIVRYKIIGELCILATMAAAITPKN